MSLMQFFARRTIFRDLDGEMQQHLDEKTEALIADGMTREEAERAARREFGNVTLVQQSAREAWMWPLAESLWADTKFGVRQLCRNYGFALTTILTLALGIGATTAIFSLVNAVLLRPLPFPQSEQLMWLAQQSHLGQGAIPQPLSYPDYFDWRTHNHTFSGIATYVNARGGITLLRNGESQRLDVETVSSNLFQVLGVSPVLGRDFTAEDEEPGHRTAMLSYSLWQSAFASAKNIIGQSITLDDMSYIVAGVMPKGFQFPLEGPPPALWMSIAEAADGKKTGERGYDVLSAIGRLKPGVTVEQATADLSLIARDLARQYPDTNKEEGSAMVEPELQHLTGDTRPALRLLFGAVILMLLIVCANVAGLLLARCSRRRSEFALRSALGASRGALIRQLLVESTILSLCGGAAGIALAWVLMRTTLTLTPLDLPRIGQTSLDGRVLLFDLALSLLTGILFGILPAWRTSGSAPANSLREGARSVAGTHGQNRVHNGLVIAQTAIGLVLLVCSGLLIRSFVRILNVDPGYDPRHVLSARIGVSFTRLSHDQHVQFYEQLLERISSSPGLQSASAGWPLPISPGFVTITFNIQGRPVARGDEPGEAMGVVMPRYFETMRIPLVAGRTFSEQDGIHGQPSIIINQAFASKYFPGHNPLGQHIQVRMGDTVFEQNIREIVGVVGNIKLKGLTEVTRPEYYLSFAQAVVINPFLIVRTTGDPALEESVIRTAVSDMDKSVPVYEVATLDDYVSKSASQPRFQAFVLTCFAGIALILAAIGLYGLLSYVVVQRTPEIGLRMALGAQRSSILGMIVRRGVLFALIGIGLGTAISLAIARLMSGMLYGIRPVDPLTFAATTGLLLLVSVLASSVPAWRAARFDPLRTLREQ